MKKLIILGVSILACAALLKSAFTCAEEKSSSMEPLISGRKGLPMEPGGPPTGKGDLVLATKWFSRTRLAAGDLVLVEIPVGSNNVMTVRQIGARSDPASGQVYVMAANDRGIDSRHFGLLPTTRIKAKVFKVVRSE